MILKPLTDHRWKGYTLDELQEKILITDTHIMLQKKAIRKNVESFKKESKNSKNGTDFFSKILGYIEYIVMAISFIRRLRPIFARFSKKK